MFLAESNKDLVKAAIAATIIGVGLHKWCANPVIHTIPAIVEATSLQPNIVDGDEGLKHYQFHSVSDDLQPNLAVA